MSHHMTWVYIRWQPNHGGPEVAIADGSGVALDFQPVQIAPGPDPHVWSVEVKAVDDIAQGVVVDLQCDPHGADLKLERHLQAPGKGRA